MGGWAHPKITIRLELEPDMKGLLPVEQHSSATHTTNLSAQVGNSPQLSLPQHLLMNPNKQLPIFTLQPFRFDAEHLNRKPQNRAAGEHVVQYRVNA